LAADAPEVLFRCIEDCAKKALLGQNPYTNKQLITNTICLLLKTGLYIRAFGDWDQLLEPNNRSVQQEQDATRAKQYSTYLPTSKNGEKPNSVSLYLIP
jgi:hypothetical protein